MLVVAFFVVMLSFLLQVGDGGRVAYRDLPQYPLPPMCGSNAWFGVKCPGCGLTRSFIHLAHGNWAASYRCHRLGWLMAAAILLQFPYRILSIRRNRRPLLGTVFPQVFGYFLIAVLIGNWLVECFRQ
jgi:hypothetical protein